MDTVSLSARLNESLQLLAPKFQPHCSSNVKLAVDGDNDGIPGSVDREP